MPPALVHEPVEQLAGAQPMRGGHDQRLAQAELVQLLGGAHGGGVVQLVGHEHGVRALAAQHLGDLEVVGQRAGAAVHHEQHDVG